LSVRVYNSHIATSHTSIRVGFLSVI